MLSSRVYLGTMNFAWTQASTYVDVPIATEMLRRFGVAGGTRLDTARIYAGGETEPMLADALAAVDPSAVPSSGWQIGTKAHPSQPGGLGAAGLQSQFDASRSALGLSAKERETEALSEYYLHQPDTARPLLESLRAADALVKARRVSRIGLSNYHADEVARCFALCEEHGLTKPSVYQGLYNPLNRAVESELLPLLRAHGCSFVAYNPLAAGLLTGRHTQGEPVARGRFLNNPNYLPRFYTEANFRALGPIRDACAASGVPMVEASYRWLLRHSALGANDGVLLGASNLEQLDSNIAACLDDGGADLPTEVAAAFDAAWEVTRDGAFCYWRSYSADMPERETRHQGASYDAAKTKKAA